MNAGDRLRDLISCAADRLHPFEATVNSRPIPAAAQRPLSGDHSTALSRISFLVCGPACSTVPVTGSRSFVEPCWREWNSAFGRVSPNGVLATVRLQLTSVAHDQSAAERSGERDIEMECSLLSIFAAIALRQKEGR